MLKKLALIQWLFVSFAYSQTTTQTDFVFNNLPAKKEIYISLRQAAMGQQLSGITADSYTDLFRNPSFLNHRDTTEFLVDFGSYQYTPYYTVYNSYDYFYMNSNDYSAQNLKKENYSNQLPNSLRIGATGTIPMNLGKYGFFVHGFFSRNISQANDQYPQDSYGDYYIHGSYLRKNEYKNQYYDIHGFYANTLAGWNIGADYTYGYTTNDNRYINNSEQDHITNNSSNYYSYRYNRYQNMQTVYTDVKTHTMRLGAGKPISENWYLDWVGTYEHSKTDKQQNQTGDRRSYDSSFYSDMKNNINDQYSVVNYLRPGQSKADDIRLDLNIKQKISDYTTLVYLAGLDYLTFDADDLYLNERDENSHQRQDTTHYYSIRHERVRDSRFSQSGSKIGGNLGFGFEYKKERFLIAGALRISGYRGQGDYEQWMESDYYNTIINQADTLLNDQRDSTFTTRTVEQKNYQYNIYLPLGCEFKITKTFLLRFGVLAHWRYNENKTFKGNYLDKTLNNQINTYYSFGFGYHKKRLGFDFYGEGDLASLNSWRLAMTYKL